MDITFERDGVQGENTVTVPRTIVQIRDVKLAALIGKAENGMGYIQLSGFTSDAGREVRQAIFALQQAAEEASNGQNSLKVRFWYYLMYSFTIVLVTSYIVSLFT